ncbi:MAG: biopolymer transporter ExbD [Alphaproteobacteria bacterium]|nr:biopolymer transporter ExbD [Alphaproteobacteria bacterium]MCB9930388.1 biopolymer transporter ExbD [Alphaproteobacteria bacterium]
MAASSLPLFRTAPEPRRRALIGLTPLIDMVFILLIFFMLASSFQDWRVIPVSAAGPVGGGAGPKGALLVQVRPDGLRLGGHPLGPEALAARVQAQMAAAPDRRVLVEPAPGVPLQAAVAVLDRLAAAGARNLSLTGGAGNLSPAGGAGNLSPMGGARNLSPAGGARNLSPAGGAPRR